MAHAEDADLIERFERFYRRYYADEIAALANAYPRERRSLYVDFSDLERFDADLADDFRSQPAQFTEHAEEALRRYDLPVDVSLAKAHVRIRGLRSVTDIRDIRSRNIGELLAVSGIVRKSTEVRPKVEVAAFECQRCGTMTRIDQPGGSFQDPHECAGCERQGPFQISFDQSEFVDSQLLRVQERPEGLRGGETPQNIDVHIEDDITGKVTPGDYVTVVGVLHLDQSGDDRDRSPVFDVYMEGSSIEIEDAEFEEMDITDEDKAAIIDLSERDGIYDDIVASIAPSIWGLEETKLAMGMQLFSGVTKHLPDGSRTRGDMHILLIGDPGTGKCQKGDTKVTLDDGREVRIRELVESNLDDPTSVNDGVYDEVDFDVPSIGTNGRMTTQRATKVWKREAPEVMYRIQTASGTELEVTPSHPLFVQSDGRIEPATADELREEEFIATPRKISTTPCDNLDVDFRQSKAPNAVRLNLPQRWTPSLARLVGYVVAEGWTVRRENHTADLRITNDDQEIIEDVADALSRLGLPYTETEPRPGKSARTVRCTAGEFVSFLENLEPAILERSAEQRVPDALMRASRAIKAQFLKAYIDGEGHVSTKEREITVASMSSELLENVRSLLLAFGIGSQLRPRHNGSHRLRVSGENYVRYVEEIGFVSERKEVAAGAFEDVDRNTNTKIVPGLSDELYKIRKALALSQFDCGIPRSTYQHYERGDRNPSHESLRSVLDTFEERLGWLRDARKRLESNEWEIVETLRRELNLSQLELADGTDVTQTAISCYDRGEVVPDGGTVADAKSVLFARIDEALDVRDDIQALRNLAEGGVSWDRIEKIEQVVPEYDWVYDLEVEGTHNYLANNVVSHNSQLLQYVRNIAPRSVYTSGKGSSSAGLTAAAVRDNFGDGQQWTLEAGALVLADKGIAAIDELDKMRSEDRSALHEGLEQQQISISKAGINATLKSRCSLLGAANPTYGRFDQYEPIGEQIDLDPPLISRFDLIFTVTDQPDEERDRRLAEHIMQVNYAGELNTHREQMPRSNIDDAEIEAVVEEVAPAIEPELLQKYVAYARRHSFPTMTDEAMDRIEEFYVDLRSQGQEEDAPVPVTARKLEALVRLAEASARVRLSDEVTVADADRVIEIVRSCLRDIGVDPETGQFDADVIETGTSKTQRDRKKSIRELVADLQTEYDDGAPLDEILSRAESAGIDPEKAERELEKLTQRGELYKPSMEHYRTT